MILRQKLYYNYRPSQKDIWYFTPCLFQVISAYPNATIIAPLQNLQVAPD